jgi:hypothetical protein
MRKQVALEDNVWNSINEIKYMLMNRDKTQYSISDTVYECVIAYKTLHTTPATTEQEPKTKKKVKK